MDLHLALYEIAAGHRLDASASHRLAHLAGLHDEPAALEWWLPRGVALLGSALIGLGGVFWIAANWDTLGRLGQFALLQGAVLVMGVGAMWHAPARVPLGLLALLAMGALFAYFGQTYQTGADPWQLFALWAALALPLCLALRSDALWTPWSLLAMTAVALWVQAHAGHRWQVAPDHLATYLVGWAAALALVAGLSHPARRFTGAGVWALRCALSLALAMITLTALGGLFNTPVAPHFWLALALLGASAALLTRPAWFEVFGLSAVALGLNTLVVAGLARLLFEGRHGVDPIGRLLLLGLLAAGLLSATVSGVMRLTRAQVAGGEQA